MTPRAWLPATSQCLSAWGRGRPLLTVNSNGLAEAGYVWWLKINGKMCSNNVWVIILSNAIILESSFSDTFPSFWIILTHDFPLPARWGSETLVPLLRRDGLLEHCGVSAHSPDFRQNLKWFCRINKDRWTKYNKSLVHYIILYYDISWTYKVRDRKILWRYALNIYEAYRCYKSLMGGGLWILIPALQKRVNSVGGTSCRSSCVTGERAAIFVI